jgi:uridine kinase
MANMVVGIGGGSASGKTTIVERLVGRFGAGMVAVIAYDRYYRDRSTLAAGVRATLNFDHPDALETELLLSHLESLRVGVPVEAPVYDFRRHTRTTDVERIAPRPVILVEGVLVLADPRLRSVMDLLVFVDTDEDARYARRLKRDVADRGRTAESVRAQFDATVLPMHVEFVEPSRRYADVIVTGGGFNAEGVEQVVREILKRLADLRRSVAR